VKTKQRARLPHPAESPRFWVAYWNSAPAHGSERDGPFNIWLGKHAPLGYRLAVVIEQPPWPGRLEMGTSRECIFEREDPLDITR